MTCNGSMSSSSAAATSGGVPRRRDALPWGLEEIGNTDPGAGHKPTYAQAPAQEKAALQKCRIAQAALHKAAARRSLIAGGGGAYQLPHCPPCGNGAGVAGRAQNQSADSIAASAGWRRWASAILARPFQSPRV